ncbi:uncharacterized protein LOC119737616 isoform X2 [Patiria miniata]|uniref:EF-hand domain-containing protein n=1 Tax=Patiria miniata TaxID=46514 RepID=A0A914AV82_PATMI|nr:uncharacterized protein LOC119737616 isoform X2 [Patiria miniata]
MIATNKDIRETDKLFKKLVAPSLSRFHLDSHIHHHAPVKMGPVLLPHRSSGHGAPQTSNATHSVTKPKSMRAPPSTEITLDESLLRIGGRATSSAVDFDESFAQSYHAASGGNLRRQHQRAGTSMSSISSTTKMKQLPLPQLQSSEVLRASSPSPRGKRNVSVCSERYLGTSVVGQPQHRRSKSAAEILHPISSNASTSDQVRRFEEERMALLQTRTLKRSTEVMAHRKDRKYHMCGSGVSIHDRYMVDSDEMDRLRQLIQARSTKRGSSPVSYYGRYGVRVTSGHGTRQTKPSTATEEQKEQQGNDIDSSQIPIETNENENNVAVATPANENGNDAMAAPTAVTDEEDGVKEDNLAVGEVDRKVDDSEVAANMVNIEKSGGKEDQKEVNTSENATCELDNLDHILPVSNDESLDVDQPVEGALTQTKDDAQESPESETKADGSHGRDPNVNPDAHPDENTKEEEVHGAAGIGEDKEVIGSEDVSEGLRGDGDNSSANAEDMEVQEIQNMMPNVRISKKLAKKSGKDAFMTDFETSDAAGDDIQDMFSNLKPDHPTSSNGTNQEDTDASRRGSSQEGPTQETSQESHHPTAEEALLGMLVSDDKIAAMEDSLRRLDRLKGGIQDVGHLEESELNLEELNANQHDVDYGEEVYGKVLNDEELKEIERLRAEKREARSAKSRKGDDTIMAEAKVSQAKSKMADIYNFISPVQQEVLEKKFQELDIDGNGVITLQELFKRMYRGRANKELGRAFMQVFDLNKDQTIDEREFVIVAALNDKLTGKLTDSADAPLELDLDRLAQSITAYKEIFQVTDQDSDGRLTLEDVMLVISLSGNLETGIDPDIVQHVHNTIDADDNGTIDFIEYLTYIPFFLKLHKRMAASRHITIAEVERTRDAVRSAILKVRGTGTREVTMKTF